MKWIKEGLYHHYLVNSDGEILATIVEGFGRKADLGQREFIDVDSAKKVVERELGQKK